MRKIVRLSAIVAIALAVVSMAGCDIFAAITMSVSGKAVNVMKEITTTSDEYWKGESSTGAAVSLEGAEITLTSLKTGDTSSFTATVSSSGQWVITGIEGGKYRIEGVQDGWTFIPMDIEVSGFLSEVTADVLAYPTPTGSPIMLIVRWTNPLIDIDSHLVIDTDATLPSTNIVYWSNPSNLTPNPGTVTLDRDVKFATSTSTTLNGYPVETIRINANPFDVSSSYAGQLRYYLESFSYLNGTTQQTTNTTLTGDPTASYTGRAEATVYVMQGTEHFGTWIMPIDTAEKTLGVIKIDVTGSATTTSYSIKSFGNEGSVKTIGIFPVVVDAIQ